jgi:hypothetical protein
MTAAWRAWVPNDVCGRRAGGRTRYNKRRQEAAEERRRQLKKFLLRSGDFSFGFQARLAKRFGVAQSTICEDLKHIFEWELNCCPLCGSKRRRRP